MTKRRMKTSLAPFARAVLLALGLATAPPAAAHDFWLEPSSYRPAAGQPLTVGLREGHGEGATVARIEDRIVRFELHGVAGRRPIAGIDGGVPAGLLPAATLAGLGGGPAWIVYRNTPARYELPADRFESYLASQGLTAAIESRRARGETGRPGRERFSRCAKTLIELPGGRGPAAAERELVTRPLGLPLEIVPEAGAVFPADKVTVRVLFRGAPLGGARLEARRRDGTEESTAVTTGADGRARLSLPAPERWLLTVVHIERLPDGATSGDGVEWESWWASLAFSRRSTASGGEEPAR